MGRTLRGVIVAGAFIGAGVLLMAKDNKISFKNLFTKDVKDDHRIEVEVGEDVETPEAVLEEMTEGAEEVEVIEPVSEEELEESIEEEIDDATDEVLEGEEEEIVEDIDEIEDDPVYCDLESRAQTIALELAKISAVSDRGLFSKEDVEEAILCLHGVNESTGAAAKIGKVNYVASFFTSIPNAPDYIIKKDELDNDTDYTVRNLNYSIGMARLIIGEQQTSCNPLLFYMDDIHTKALNSASRSFTEQYCLEFFKCLGSIVYGDGFMYYGVNYTIQDLTGPENLLPNAIVQLFINDLDPLSDAIEEVTITLANGNTKTVKIIDICAPFRINGEYYESWVNDMENPSMSK